MVPCVSFSSLEGEVHCSAEDAVKFIEDRIMEASQNARHVRGPHLAKLELIRRLRSQGCNDEYKLGKNHWTLGNTREDEGYASDLEFSPHYQCAHYLKIITKEGLFTKSIFHTYSIWLCFIYFTYQPLFPFLPLFPFPPPPPIDLAFYISVSV